MYILYHYIIHYHHHHHHDAVSPGFYSGDDFPQRDLRFFFRTRVRGRTFPHLFTASKEGFHVNLPLFINPFWDCVMMEFWVEKLGTRARGSDGMACDKPIQYIYIYMYIYIYGSNNVQTGSQISTVQALLRVNTPQNHGKK